MSATPTSGAVLSGLDLQGSVARWRGTRRGRLALYVAAVALVALAYYLAGRIGLELAYLNGAVAALWPPAGLGLAVLFLGGVRLWPGVVIGDLWLGDFSTPFATVLAQTVGNTIALVVAVLVLRRLTGGGGGPAPACGGPRPAGPRGAGWGGTGARAAGRPPPPRGAP